MPAAPRPTLPGRVPARGRTVLAWSGLALSPLLLYLWIASGGSPYVLPTVAMVLPLAVLRRRPLVVLGVLLAEVGMVELAPLPGFHAYIWYLQTVTVVFAVGYITATRRSAVSIVAAALALAMQLAVAITVEPWPGNLQNAVIQDVLEVVSVWMIGYTIRQRRQHREARRAQAEARAVQAERLRIARELHDMIAHSIGVIAIQAGMGSRVIDTQPGEARSALRAIEDTSRDTLAGLRRMLGALRRSDPEPAITPLGPAPGLADLDGLVARSRDAGIHVDVRWCGDRHPLPPDVDLSAFRIIQEAVTNVVRHAGTRRCEVAVDRRDEELSIEVTDEGRGGVEGAGYGISGMRERVALLHGDFTAGPRSEGGFRVAARIPVPAGVR